MSGFVNATVSSATMFHLPAAFVRRALDRARLALVHRRGRQLLAQMDDRMLADIGASRSDAVMEASRPIWELTGLHR